MYNLHLHITDSVVWEYSHFLMDTKQNIKKVVEDYIRIFPDEYATAIKGTEMLRSMTQDEFASIDGWYYGRALYEVPETLHNMLVKMLPEEDLKWLKEGGVDRKQGGRWFARTFPEFAIAQKI